MDETLTLLPKSFVNKMIKNWMEIHIKVVAQLSKFVNWNQKKLTNGTNLCGNRKR